MREKLIRAIYEMQKDLLGDSADDVLMLAIQTDEQLVDQLIHIAQYLKTNHFDQEL
jgi:hypothetical protein